MAGKTHDPEFRHLDTVACLQGLTDAEAAKRSLLIREPGGGFTEYWREGGPVRCREVGADEASGGPAPEMGALHATAQAEFGCSFSRMRTESRGDWVPVVCQ